MNKVDRKNSKYISMKLTNLMPSDLIEKLEQNKSIFCKFGEVYKITINQRNIKYADFVELFTRSYGNAYFASDIKSKPIGYEEFQTLEFREFYPEFFVYNQIDNTGNEALFDSIVNQATLLPLGFETRVVNLASTTNINITLRPESTEKLFTSTEIIDGETTIVNNKILLKNQTNKLHNGIWKVIKKNDNYAVGKNYVIGDLFLNAGLPYLVTTNFIASDFITDAPNYQSVPLFTINTNYVVDDYVYLPVQDGKFIVYKCLTSHAGTTFFRTNNFGSGQTLDTYDWWERTDLTGKVEKAQHIEILSGLAQIGLCFEYNIPLQKEYVYFGGYNAEEIDFTSSLITVAQLPNILSNQTILMNLTSRVKDLYKAKWFPSKWLE